MPRPTPIACGGLVEEEVEGKGKGKDCWPFSFQIILTRFSFSSVIVIVVSDLESGITEGHNGPRTSRMR